MSRAPTAPGGRPKPSGPKSPAPKGAGAKSPGPKGATDRKPASTTSGQPKRAGAQVPLPYVVEATFLGAMAPGGTPPPPTFAEVAFAGRSNVGKSSLINCLVERKGLVRTSGTPGCTRQVNMFDVRTRDGAQLVLADLPGYGFARRSKDERASWAKLIEAYLTTRPTLRALVVLVDARRAVEEEELELVNFVRKARASNVGEVEVLLVATKADKLPRSSAKATIERLGRAVGAHVLGFSSVTGEGRDALWKSLRRAMHLVVEPPVETGAEPDAAPADR